MNKIISLLMISLCISSSFADETQSFDNNVVNGSECSLCEWGTTQVENFLASNYTETKIQTLMTDLCSHLPSNLGDLCNQVVVPNIPSIIAALENKETPETVCTQLHFCQEQDLRDFFSHYSTPHLYGLTMFLREHFNSKPILNDYMMNIMNHYCF